MLRLLGSSPLVAFDVTKRLLGSSRCISCHDGGHWACLVLLQFDIAMEVVGLVLSCLVDFVVTRKVVGLNLLHSSLQGGLHTCLVTFVIARRSSGSSCCVCYRKEVIMLFDVIIKHPCRPCCVEVAAVVVLLLSLSPLRFSGPLFFFKLPKKS